MTQFYLLLYLASLACVAVLSYLLGRRSASGSSPAPKVEETYSRAQVDEFLGKMNQRLKKHWEEETRKYTLCTNYSQPNRNKFDDISDVVKKLNKTVFDDLRSRIGNADRAHVTLKWRYFSNYLAREVSGDMTSEMTGGADTIIDQIVNLIIGNVIEGLPKCYFLTMEVTFRREVAESLPHRVERVYLRPSGEPVAVELSSDEIEARRKAEQEVERLLEATKRVVGRSEAARA